MFKAIAVPAFILALACSSGHAQSPSTHQHSFGNAEQWAHVFDDPKRDVWQKPHEVIKALALAPDAVVADIGAGTGYFSARLATMLPQGRVFAADIEPSMVRYLSERAARERLANMVPVLSHNDTPGLPVKVDLVLMVDTYHHIESREQYFRELRKSLKPGGRLAVIDFRMDSPEGPPKQARLTPAQVTGEMARAGYMLAAQHDFLPRQYFLVFRPAP